MAKSFCNFNKNSIVQKLGVQCIVNLPILSVPISHLRWISILNIHNKSIFELTSEIIPEGLTLNPLRCDEGSTTPQEGNVDGLVRPSEGGQDFFHQFEGTLSWMVLLRWSKRWEAEDIRAPHLTEL